MSDFKVELWCILIYDDVVHKGGSCSFSIGVVTVSNDESVRRVSVKLLGYFDEWARRRF